MSGEIDRALNRMDNDLNEKERRRSTSSHIYDMKSSFTKADNQWLRGRHAPNGVVGTNHVQRV